MESKISNIEKDLERLLIKSVELWKRILQEISEKKQDDDSKNNSIYFCDEYEQWYSEAYSVIKLILPDRLNDFSILYRNDNRKEFTSMTYTISDYIIGIVRKDNNNQIIVTNYAAIPKFRQQINILKSVKSRFKSSLFDIKQIIQADIFDNELDTSGELCKKGFLRGAGAIVGVVLEKHLSEVCQSHNIKSRKKNPTINDWNDLLKTNEIINLPTWRSIQHLGDIRNLCDHNKDVEPTKDNIEELIDGVKKITKTVF